MERKESKDTLKRRGEEGEDGKAKEEGERKVVRVESNAGAHQSKSKPSGKEVPAAAAAASAAAATDAAPSLATKRAEPAPAMAAAPAPAPPRARPFGKSKAVITITYGDCAENHVGMQKLGEAASEGLSCAELVLAKQEFEERLGCTCELIDLVAAGQAEGLEPAPEPASVLIVRGGVAALLGGAAGREDMLHEQLRLNWDTKAFMKGRVVNKHARHNLCYAPTGQAPDYEHGRGTVVAFDDIPLTQRVRELLPTYFGEKTQGLFAEGNLYFDPAECGIGFHGDAERRIVVALRLGGALPLHYQWFQQSKPVGQRVKLMLQDGDLYAMSAKAVGTDWLKKIIPTLRHAAGAPKFLRIDPKK
eukprot:m.245321 g.245321  ORF g.245321 m.245321 type:complete len:361 (-) comp36312_c0_seq1:23-1105(-)